MLSLALLVCVWCSVCLWLKYARVKSSSKVLPPAPPGGLPFIGHSFHLLKNNSNLWDYLKYIAEDCAKQGGVTYVKLGSDPYYLITDPQDAVTASNACIKKHYAYDSMKPWMGDGLLISSGEIWKRHRKLMIPAFTLPVVYGFLDVFNSQAKKLADLMEPHLGKGPFDHSVYLKDNSLETFCIGTLGINPIDDVKFTQKYMKSVHRMLNMGVIRVIKFWLQNDFMYRLVGLKKKEDELVNTLHTMVDKVLQEKKAAMNDAALDKHYIVSDITGMKYKPFLDLLLELSKNGALSDKEIREETDVITAAGFETTSNHLMFTLLVLGAYPEVQEKVYQEFLEVVGAERDVEKDDVSKLVYTNAVLMECLRLYPSVPLLVRHVVEDVKLKNYTMHAGSNCVIFPLATHLDPTWGAESDKFRPERWLDANFKNNKEFAAFGLGKRACIGRTYAMVSMKVTLAHFLRRYRIKADVSKLKLKYEFILKPDRGHEISIERRT